MRKIIRKIWVLKVLRLVTLTTERAIIDYLDYIKNCSTKKPKTIHEDSVLKDTKVETF